MLFALRPDLLDGLREGEPAALEEVYRVYVQSVTQTVSATLRRSRGCESWQTIAAELADIVQETFIRAFSAGTRERFDGVREYGPFVRQIAQHATIDYLRSRAKHVAGAQPVDEEALVSPGGDASDAFADAETEAIVSRYIAELEPPMREVHHALFVQGLSQREAAEALGMGRQVIRTLEAKLKDGLRHRLGQGMAHPAHPAQPKSA